MSQRNPKKSQGNPKMSQRNQKESQRNTNMWRSMPEQEIGAGKKFEVHQTKECVLKSVEFDTS